MIEDIVQLEDKVVLAINTSKKKELDFLFQKVIYQPSLEHYLALEKKVLGFRNNEEFKQLKPQLKSDYYIHLVKESPHYFYDTVMSNLYKVIWAKKKTTKVDIEVGDKLYHLTRPERVESILKNGLIPTMYSEDDVYYGANKVFFSTKPILDDDTDYLDVYLRDRVQLEIIYDGSYELFVDTEYNHFENHTMVFGLTDNPVPIHKVSDIQPKRIQRMGTAV